MFVQRIDIALQFLGARHQHFEARAAALDQVEISVEIGDGVRYRDLHVERAMSERRATRASAPRRDVGATNANPGRDVTGPRPLRRRLVKISEEHLPVDSTLYEARVADDGLHHPVRSRHPA